MFNRLKEMLFIYLHFLTRVMMNPPIRVECEPRQVRRTSRKYMALKRGKSSEKGTFQEQCAHHDASNWQSSVHTCEW